MATKLTLHLDLYENALTEVLGDYSAKVKNNGTLHNADIAERIVEERTEYRKETIENILNMADLKKAQAVAQGMSMVDGVGYYHLSVSGVFMGEQPVFDPKIHRLNVMYTPGKVLLDMLKEVEVSLPRIAQSGPVINSITDSTTQKVNSTITSGAPAILSGATLLIKGDDPSNGVYFTKDGEEGTSTKVSLIISNTASQIIFSIPTLADGKYRVSVTTQCGSGYTLVKSPRTYTLPLLLTVGEESDRPEEI